MLLSLGRTAWPPYLRRLGVFKEGGFCLQTLTPSLFLTSPMFALLQVCLHGRKTRVEKPKKRAQACQTLLSVCSHCVGSGQEVCFGPSRPDPGRNARGQDGTRTGWDGPHLGIWMGPKHCRTKHMANLDGTASDPGWDLPEIGPRWGSGWHPQRQ